MVVAQSGVAGPRDTLSDTWFAIDALGRQTPTNPPLPRPGRYVAMFYFLWLGEEGENGPYDVSKILQQHPDAMLHPDDPLWGPPYAAHHWGESVFGYYRSADEWVLRKHAQMLSDAGVDTVIFDNSNQVTYPRSYLALCRVWSQVRSEGGRTPQIAFLAPFGAPGPTVRKLWEEFYSRCLYSDLLFRWKGKPLILADPDQITPESLNGGVRSASAAAEEKAIKAFFTFRKPQPDYFQGPTQRDEWAWLETFPQHMFRDHTGLGEEMSVGVAQNAVDGHLSVLSNPKSLGRSSVGAMAAGPDHWNAEGANFQQQWDRVLKADPEIVFVTGWNEWIAGRFGKDAPFYDPGPVNFVDEFDPEHSRDIEPANDALQDSFYYQLVRNVRTYKGARPPPIADGRHEIPAGAEFSAWDPVSPLYLDDAFDTASRDSRGWGALGAYVDQTGRNDLVRFKVAVGRTQAAFLAESREPFRDVDSNNPLTLWIRIAGVATSRLGFNYRVSMFGAADGNASLEAFQPDGWVKMASVKCFLSGPKLEVFIPLNLLHISSDGARFDFKWTDNIDFESDPLNLYRHGDAAPNGRFMYRFVGR